MSTTRRKILEHAIETIIELGFAQASIGQIAKRAGMSKGVITYHFSSRDELIDQLVAELWSSAAAFMAQIASEPTPTSMLRRYIETNLAFMRAHRKHVAAVIEITLNMRTKNGKLRYTNPENDSMLLPLIDIIRWGQAEGEFYQSSALGAKVLAMTIRNAIDQAGLLMAREPHFDLQAYASELVTVFGRAACKQPLATG